MRIPVRIVRRHEISRGAQAVVPLVAVILALAVGALFLLLYGISPIMVYREMLGGAFGSYYGVSETVVKAIPLMLAGLAVSLAFRMQLWNIGAEGQIYLGAFAASGVALFSDLPPVLLLPAMLFAAFLAGACWGLIPGILKGFWDVNETIVSLMLNYVGILWVEYLVFGPWRDPQGFNYPLTRVFPEGAALPPLLPTSRVHAGLLVALVIAGLLWYVIRSTRWGYEIRVLGESWPAARYAGMNTIKNVVLVFLISGGIAGIAGMVEVAGVTHRLQQGLSPGYGYTGIIVAWLARLNPFAIILVSFLLGALLVAGYSIQTIGLPFSVVSMLQGLILFFLLGGELFITHEITWDRKRSM
ncbi:MAG: ABC transporter permease [Solirubrobacterales bacterium]